MRTIGKILLILIILAGVAFSIGRFVIRHEEEQGLVLYGNVDQRLVELAFIDPERIGEVLAEEGDVVQPGQALARQEDRRLRDRIASLEAEVKAASVTLTKLKNGTRPDEVARDRAAVTAAEAESRYADQQYQRYRKLWETSEGSISVKDVDDYKKRADVAKEDLEQVRRTLDLAVEGPRWEDIAEAEANLDVRRRTLEEYRNRLKDAELRSPAHSVVRSRLMEPGDMASAQRPVFSLAVISPKWVRAYVSETDMGRVRPGMEAAIHIDSFPGKTIRGTVGFISPIAEFTPKTVQTEELRTSLVYEVRVYVEDERDRLRLGMPATVRFPDTSSQESSEAVKRP